MQGLPRKQTLYDAGQASMEGASQTVSNEYVYDEIAFYNVLHVLDSPYIIIYPKYIRGDLPYFCVVNSKKLLTHRHWVPSLMSFCSGMDRSWKFHLPSGFKAQYLGSHEQWAISWCHLGFLGCPCAMIHARWFMFIHVPLDESTWGPGCSEDRPWFQPGWDQSSFQAHGPAGSPWQGREQGRGWRKAARVRVISNWG